MARTPKKVLVQVLFDQEEFAMIESLALRNDITIPHWVRGAARMRLGLVVVDAWTASVAENEDARLTREATPHGNYKLFCLVPPVGGSTIAEVHWVRNGHRGTTAALTRSQLLGTGLDSYDPFSSFGEGKVAVLYLRGGGYWRVVSIFSGQHGAAAVELNRVALTSREYREYRDRQSQ